MDIDSIKFIIITDKPALFQESPDRLIMTPKEFFARPHLASNPKKPPKIINLSNRYDYLSKGYYVSLLAEARGMVCIPDVSNIIRLGWKRNYDSALPELNQLLEKNYKEPFEEPLERTYTTFFGRHTNPKIEPIARRLFDLFRFPILSIKIKYGQNSKWMVEKIDDVSLSSLVDKQLEQFQEALSKFTGSAWRSASKHKKQERYWLGILHDPEEKNAPSNKAALKKFIEVGKKMNLWVELITKNDFATLLEYDALFIRETTAINNHTYRFASKAEQEDIPCVDDTQSIIRCCNKVYLKELLDTKKIPTPKTLILDKTALEQGQIDMDFPFVLKIPDGAFSKGVEKVKDKDEFKTKASAMFKNTDIILCQEFVPSVFDWRIGVLNGEALFASKYYMAEGHWQIYNHDAKKKKQQSGEDESVPLDEVPKEIIKTAVNAANLIGKGLYGVDLKQLEDGRILVIEVNDNPNIDVGVEDKILGDELYRKILQYFIQLIEE